MHYPTITQTEFFDVPELIGSWTNAVDVPSDLRDLMLSGQGRYDYYTPLRDVKEILFEGLLRHQPHTANLLMNAKPLVLRARSYYDKPSNSPSGWALDFGLEVEGQMVMIERLYHGQNLNDPGYEKPQPISLEWALPPSLRESYYTTFNGMKVPDGEYVSVFGRFMPRNVSNWTLWNNYLGQFRGYKKKYIPWLEERLPLVKPSKPSKYGYFDFRCFLESVPDEKSGEVDYLWVKSFHEDGTVYHIRGKDVENMRIVSEPAEAVDRYCEHVLLRKEGRFDFLEFTSDL
ncbi:hypothetical protein [Agrobacterium sp. Azo12]|jgi:hypothetical protein|uniref:hypothetical protein n=1 Tax=Agrobacterium sp. Azo12 TaxID=3031129 RepID=UPI0023D8984D|nr:hypothetical protein [Agrobacterium sp. Azo12]MDO5897875.1 hypothetical protein [Agrobacterium sp. Azo12]